MSRDVLITLLVLGLAANILLVAGVVWLNFRATRRRATLSTPSALAAAAPGAPVASEALDPACAGTPGPAPASAGLGSPERADDADPQPAIPVVASIVEPAQLPSPARPPAARRTPRTRSRAAAAAAAPPAVSSGAGGRRSRRFAMPDDDGSHARTDQAIAAFLGEPVARDPEARTSRRRHRARRPAGAAVPRTDLVLSLAGAEPDPRLVHALSAAMRGTVRSSDEVVELPGGRLRITLEADVPGGEAFVRRARAVVKPWLTALDPDLQLRVQRPRQRQGAASPS